MKVMCFLLVNYRRSQVAELRTVVLHVVYSGKSGTSQVFESKARPTSQSNGYSAHRKVVPESCVPHGRRDDHRGKLD